MIEDDGRNCVDDTEILFLRAFDVEAFGPYAHRVFLKFLVRIGVIAVFMRKEQVTKCA